jgi:hypothetical protein
VHSCYTVTCRNDTCQSTELQPTRVYTCLIILNQEIYATISRTIIYIYTIVVDTKSIGVSSDPALTYDICNE